LGSGLQFGAGLRASRVNGCEVVLRAVCGFYADSRSAIAREATRPDSAALKLVVLVSIGVWADDYPMHQETLALGSFRLIPAQRMLLDNGKPLRPGSRGGSFRSLWSGNAAA